VEFELVNSPKWLQESLLNDLSDLSKEPWSEASLCQRVYHRLSPNTWIRKVLSVSKSSPGRVRIQCEYRLPMALVQYREYFYLVDEYGIRLPGKYSYQAGWLLIQGVEELPPEPGKPWPGKDIDAGTRLANMILPQPYNGQVVSILVHNYAGRQDSYSCHIELATDRDSSRIMCGSAPGEELEENSAPQKLDLLWENYRRYGHIDANHYKIDISVFPDRFIVPA